MLQGLTPEPTTPSWEEGCFQMGKDYELLINTAKMSNISHAVECQHMCQLVIGCKFFTFHWKGENKGNCYLKSTGLSTLLDVEESISGPQFC